MAAASCFEAAGTASYRHLERLLDQHLVRLLARGLSSGLSSGFSIGVSCGFSIASGFSSGISNGFVLHFAFLFWSWDRRRPPSRATSLATMAFAAIARALVTRALATIGMTTIFLATFSAHHIATLGAVTTLSLAIFNEWIRRKLRSLVALHVRIAALGVGNDFEQGEILQGKGSWCSLVAEGTAEATALLGVPERSARMSEAVSGTAAGSSTRSGCRSRIHSNTGHILLTSCQIETLHFWIGYTVRQSSGFLRHGISKRIGNRENNTMISFDPDVNLPPQ
jgi:hypothetical protein